MMTIRRSPAADERGAILVQAAIAILVLTALATFVVDHGVLWVSRGQAQNAADAGALSGAIARLYDEPANPPASNGKAFASATGAAVANTVWTAAPTAQVSWACPPGVSGSCARVDVYRNGEFGSTPLPTIFGTLLNVSSQGVRATATAQVASGNSVKCMLPFAVIDRWADNYDPTPVTTFFPNDNLTGTAGWTPNDSYQPTTSPADVYIPPYAGNAGHTGWKVTADYGRQLILKEGSSGNYSSGWSQLVCLSGAANCGGSDIASWLTTCNPQAVGIASAGNACTDGDESHGCIDVKSGGVVGPVAAGVNTLVASDPAVWNPSADGPGGPGKGAVTGGKGMSSPRIRGIVVLDINHYVASGCSGGTCVGKVANIIGFFLEGICNTVALDPGLACDQPNKDIVGRIVTVPGQDVVGTGGVESNASFLKVVRLVQ